MNWSLLIVLFCWIVVGLIAIAPVAVLAYGIIVLWTIAKLKLNQFVDWLVCRGKYL